MTEEQALVWLDAHVPRETRPRLEHLVALVRAEMANQNLISAASAEHVWARHIVDSAQLVGLSGGRCGRWIDVGTGAGFPGLVVAIIRDDLITMIEPRPRRTDFLSRVVEELGLENAEIRAAKAQSVQEAGAILSARAVAPASQLLDWASHLAASDALWLLPKGRSARSELAEAKRTWQGVFHVERSVTDAESGIIVAHDVRRRRR